MVRKDSIPSRMSLPIQEQPLDRRIKRSAYSLETVVALSLCLVVVLASMALIELDHRIGGSYLEVPFKRVLESKRRPLPAVPFRSPPRLVCLVSLDGLRADRLAFGEDSPRPLPELHAFSKKAVSFRFVGAQASHSLISLKTIFTGKYPASLLVEETSADLLTLASLESARDFLLEAFAGVDGTLAASLKAAGYVTGAFASGSWATRANGFAEGFDCFEEGNEGFEVLTSRAAAWLSEAPGRPTFLFLETDELEAELASALPQATYDRTLERIDSTLGAFLQTLRDLGSYEESLIVVTSGHGTSLGERGIVGAGDLYLEQLLVPLIVKFPRTWNVAPRRFDGPVELIDLYPTLLLSCGIPVPFGVDGSSLLPLVFRGIRGRELLVAQTALDDEFANATRRTVYELGAWQVIHDAKTDEVLFFDLAQDPAGLHPGVNEDVDLPSFVERLLYELPADAAQSSAGGNDAAPVR